MEHGLSLQDAVALSRPDHEVDRAGKLLLRVDESVVFTFGAHREGAHRGAPGYPDWRLREAFPRNRRIVSFVSPGKSFPSHRLPNP